MTSLRSMFAALSLGALLGAGCAGNDCQQLCKEIANYWDDCEIAYGDAEVADCKKSFKAKGEDFEKYESSCRQLVSNTENADGERVSLLRERFTCDDMELGPGGAFGGQ